jgi:hypothetical protein
VKRLLIALLAVGLLVGGCIVTGNLFIEIDVGDLTANAGENFASEEVDLNDYSEYRDNKEDLNSVDDVAFVAKVTNTSNNPATGQIYVVPEDQIQVAPSSKLATIPSDAILIFDGLEIAAGQTRKISLNESYDYLRNFEEGREVILGEEFTIYFTSETTPFTLQIEDLVFILTINGKP